MVTSLVPDYSEWIARLSRSDVKWWEALESINQFWSVRCIVETAICEGGPWLFVARAFPQHMPITKTCMTPNLRINMRRHTYVRSYTTTPRCKGPNPSSSTTSSSTTIGMLAIISKHIQMFRWLAEIGSHIYTISGHILKDPKLINLFFTTIRMEFRPFFVYVDDIPITGSSLTFVEAVISLFNSKFILKVLGKLHYFLGVEAVWDSNGVLLTQTKYITNLLSETNVL